MIYDCRSVEPDNDAVPDAGIAAETDAASAALSEASIRGPYGTITVELAENWNYTASAVDEDKLFSENSQHGPQLVAQRIGGDTWTSDMWDEALQMMDTVRFDTGNTAGGVGQYIPESENDTVAVAMSVKQVTPSGLIVHFRQYDKRNPQSRNLPYQ